MSDHESPEEIERDIEQTRAHVSRTLNDLQQRLSPSSLIGETLSSATVGSALRSARSGTADFATSLGRAMSHHPLPVLLTGIGIAWLVFSSRSGENGEPRREGASYDPDRMPTPREDLSPPVDREDPSRRPTYRQAEDEALRPSPGGTASSGDFGTAETGNGGQGNAGAGAAAAQPFDTRTDAEVTEELKAAAASKRTSGIGQRAAERTRGAAASLSSGVGRVSQTLSQGVERMAGAVKGGGGAAYRTTKDVAERATYAARQVPARVGSVAQSTGSFIQENPIISGAIAVGLGAALALMIPSSRRERRLIGEASDEVKSSVRQAVEEKVERAKDVVRTAAEAAADAARKEATAKGREPAAAGAAGDETAGAPTQDRPGSAADMPGSVRDVGRPAASSEVDIPTGSRPATAGEAAATVGPSEEVSTGRVYTREDRIKEEKV
jgi:Protein of unknown function (DUF3618)